MIDWPEVNNKYIMPRPSRTSVFAVPSQMLNILLDDGISLLLEYRPSIARYDCKGATFVTVVSAAPGEKTCRRAHHPPSERNRFTASPENIYPF